MNSDSNGSSPATARSNGTATPSDSRREEGRQPATVIVHGETAPAREDSGGRNAAGEQQAPSDGKAATSQPRLSAARVEMQKRLPALGDDADVGVQKSQVVVRDGEPDLAFTGTLLAAAAPDSAPKGEWQELRVYETDGGTHVFSRTTRKVEAGEEDRHEAEVFDPSPDSTTAKLLRRAHELTHSRPMDWRDAAAKFFGYEPLPKALYRKLGGQFEEHIR